MHPAELFRGRVGVLERVEWVGPRQRQEKQPIGRRKLVELMQLAEVRELEDAPQAFEVCHGRSVTCKKARPPGLVVRLTSAQLDETKAVTRLHFRRKRGKPATPS